MHLMDVMHLMYLMDLMEMMEIVQRIPIRVHSRPPGRSDDVMPVDLSERGQSGGLAEMVRSPSWASAPNGS